MKPFLYLLCLFCVTKNGIAQEKILQVTDAIGGKDLEKVIKTHRYSEYVSYIVNKNYVIYQKGKTNKILHPDMATFENKGYNFAMDKNGVYYKGNFFAIDTTGFKILAAENIYDERGNYKGEKQIWRTNKKVFWENKEIKVIDPTTFEAVSYCYFKDKYCLYYYDQIIPDANPHMLQGKGSEEKFISDNLHTYYNGKPFIYKGEEVLPLTSMIYKTSKHVLRYNDKDYNDKRDEPEVYFVDITNYFDVPTLQKLDGGYLRDKNHLYYDKNSYPFYEDTILKLPIAKENLDKIKVLAPFIIDGNTIYERDKKIDRYDVATFAIFPDYYYFQYDKNGVYNWDKKIPFHYTKPPKYGENLFYINNEDLFIYENQAYYNGYGDSLYVNNLTPKQIETLKAGKTSLQELISPQKELPTKEEEYTDDFYKAANQIYVAGKPQKEIDATTFKEIAFRTYKDKNNVYYYQRRNEESELEPKLLIIKGYDVPSLTVVFEEFLADKDYLYFERTRLFKNKNVELLAVYEGYRKGCGQDTTPTTNYYLFKNVEGYWIAELGGEYNTLQFLGKKLK
ncbi:MAG: DKNYY domain-containing protein [Capnocytophaga sp.]|nr:DKNYY domain-containing protein [Capnocytophaga sp.]